MSSSPSDAAQAQRHPEREPVAQGLAGFLAGVDQAIAQALRHGATARARTTTNLPASALDKRTRLEDLVLDLMRAGGKLIRPRVLLLGYLAIDVACEHDCLGCADQIAGATADPQLIRLGSALELLHVFGLLQDDVMDEAATRRGAPTAHHALARRHEAFTRGPGGDRFGESMAVLAGDLAFALAQLQLRGMPASVADAWDDAVLELVHGQRLDLVFAAEGRFDIPSTQRVAASKSGAYTVTRPLELGALLARPAQEPPSWLTSFGEHVGQAFALADDVLGIWGDPQVTGKPVGDDLAQKKPTTVLGLADHLMDGQLHAVLRPDAPAPGPSQVAELMQAMERAGVAEQAHRQIDEHLAAAETELENVDCPQVRAELARVAHKLALRTS